MERDAEILTICKVFRFDSAHWLGDVNKPHPENMRVYGKCARQHGHSYKLEVYIRGPVEDHGMVMNFSDLKTKMQEYIDTHLDHRSLNDYVLLPTAENILIRLWRDLGQGYMLGPMLCKLRLWETETCFAEVSQ